MLLNLFRLKSTLARNTHANPDDTFNTKRALNALGHYRPGTGAIDDKPDNGLFEGIRRFQSAFGLKRDGVMKPGGETERTLGRVLGKTNGSVTKPSSLLATIPAPKPKSPLPDPFPATTPDIMPGEHDHMGLPGPIPVPPTDKTPKSQSAARVLADGLLDLIRRKAGDDEVVSSNARTVQAALKTSDRTNLARVHATAVRDFGDDALAELVDFSNQLMNAGREAHKSWLEAFAKERPDDARRIARAGHLLAEQLYNESPKGGAENDTPGTEKRPRPVEEQSGQDDTGDSPANEPGTDKDYESPVHRAFRDEIHKWESAEDGYEAHNKESEGIGALGRYQMRQGALKDVGMIDDAGEWTEKYGVNSTEDFLNNPDAQERAFADYMAKVEGYLRHNGSYDTRCQKFTGKLGKRITITESGLLAAAHRRGHKHVKGYLEHQQSTGWTSNFSNLSDDERAIYLSIETRLRVFQNIPYRNSGHRPCPD